MLDEYDLIARILHELSVKGKCDVKKLETKFTYAIKFHRLLNAMIKVGVVRMDRRGGKVALRITEKGKALARTIDEKEHELREYGAMGPDHETQLPTTASKEIVLMFEPVIGSPFGGIPVFIRHDGKYYRVSDSSEVAEEQVKRELTLQNVTVKLKTMRVRTE